MARTLRQIFREPLAFDDAGPGSVIPLHEDGDPDDLGLSLEEDSAGEGHVALDRVHLSHDEMPQKRARTYTDLRWGSRDTVDTLITPAGDGSFALPAGLVTAQLVNLQMNPPRAIVPALVWTPVAGFGALVLSTITIDWLITFGAGQGVETLVVSGGAVVGLGGAVQLLTTLKQLALPARDLLIEGRIQGTGSAAPAAAPFHLISRFSAFAAPISLGGLDGTTG